MDRPRDGFLLEVFALVAALVGGAVLRYWLSTVVPFDPAEQAILADAADPERALRVPFIMQNGVSLFLLYVLGRRALGVLPAFAALLALQSSLTFQYEALRVRLWSPALLLAMVAIVWFLPRLPTWRPARELRLGFAVLALLLAGRELYLLGTLRARMQLVRANSAADTERLRASVASCGDPSGVKLARLQSCDVAWPESRSLDQQEALWEHQRRVGGAALAVAGPSAPLPDRSDLVALFDARGAGFIVVEDGTPRTTARRVLGMEGR